MFLMDFSDVSTDDSKFCGCCDDSVKELAKLTLEQRLQGTDNEGMKEVLVADNMANLGPKGLELVNWCIDFLLFGDLGRNFDFLKTDQSGPHRSKYITIWSFVYDFLKIPKDSGYDYWLLSFLEWSNIMEHGSGIRCGWLNSNFKPRRALSKERRDTIFNWATNAPDNV